MQGHEKKSKLKHNIVFYLLTGIIIIVFLSISYQTLIVLAAQELTSKEQITQEENSTITANNSIELLEADTLIGEEAKVSSAQIIQTKTGIGPFDENDEAGNDSSESNNIVRTFDKVTWTIESTMILKNSSEGKNYSGGVIEVKAELPDTCSNVVKWDLNSMAWAQNAVLSEDGRIFTAQYQMTTSEVTVPGKQTLVFTLDVLWAQNGLEISPEFTIGLLGNNDDEKYKIQNVDTVYVSAAPRYNIVLQNNEFLQNNVEVDLGEGKASGKMYGYGIMLELYNQDVSKGMKGIEYPRGEITFDINLKLERSSFDDGQLEDITTKCTPVLWNYDINGSKVGLIEGRDMYTNGRESNMVMFSMPLGTSTSDRIYHTKDSGNVTMIQSGDNIKVKISDYSIDEIFPTYSYVNYSNRVETPTYSANEGIFNVSYFQIFVPENEESTIENRNYYLTVSNDNFKATSISGVEVNIQEKEDDDKSTMQHLIYGIDKYSHSFILNRYTSGVFQPLGSTFTSGDAYANIGQIFEIRVRSKLNTTNSFDINSMCKFVKFDGEAIEPMKYNDGSIYKKYGFDGSMEFKVWYVTKKDGANWIDQNEMNNADIEDMNIYESIEEIPDGYICIGVFFESTGGNLAVSSGGSNTLGIRVKIKETAKIGKTYGFTQRTKYWKEELDRSIYTITNKDVEYPNLTWDSGNLQYVKTEYDKDGEMIAGTHKGGNVYGNTVLVLGAQIKVSRNTDDKTDDGKEKSIYDIGKNEYDITYKVLPSITNDSSKNKITGINLKITDTLPKGITYKLGSCTYEEPEIVNNEDGTTTLIWYKYNCSVGEDIEPIIYKAHINEETENGIQFETKTLVQEVLAENEVSKIGITSAKLRTVSNTIQVVNLQSYAFYKTTDTPVIEVNGIGHYKVSTINKTDSEIADFQLLDILPYNGDNRGTSFNGEYTIEKIKIKQINSDGNVMDNSNLNLYITNDESVRKNITAKDENLGTGSIWEKVYNEEINKPLAGYAITGEIDPKVRVEVDIYFKTNENKSKDVYVNSATAQTNSLTEEMQTTEVLVSVISRKLEGKVWLDKNKNGIIDNEEKYLPEIKVSLVKEDGTEALDVNGQIIGDQVTDENGYYSFENVQKGNYKVLVKLEDDRYEITKKDVGSNEEINNKFNSDCLTDIITDLDNSTSPLIVVKNVNAGIAYKDTSVLVHHYIEGTTTKISNDVVIPGLIEDEYNTSVSNDIPANYEIALVPDNAKGTMTKEQIEVNYYYKLKTPSIKNSEISKNTIVEKITDIEEKIPYKINYKAIVDKYIGNAQLTIIDELPYKINVAKSNLQGGAYDSINKTITWTENITNIDTFSNGEKEIDFTKNIEIVYDTIDVNDKEVKNTVKARLELGTPVAIDTIETTESIETEYLVNITVNKNWVDNNNSYDKRPQNVILQIKNEQTQEIVQSYNLPKSESSHTFTGLAKYNSQGEKIQYIVEEKETKEGDLFYYSIQIGQMQEIKQDNKEVVITNTMTKIPSNVIVKYVDKKTNEEISEQLQKEGIVGEKFDISNDKREIPEYILIEEPEEKIGTYTNETQIKTYYYIHVSAGVIEKHIDYISGELLLSNKYDGNEGDFYTTTAKDFENYDLVEFDKDGNSLLPNNAQGKMKKEITEVNYYYKKKSKVIVEYIDKSTNEKIEDDIIIYGHESDRYNTDKKEIKYYNFVESTDNTIGNMSKETIIVKYYYEKQIFNLKIDKWVESISINGNVKQARTIDTKDKIYKIDISKKDVNSTDLKIKYKIRISNDGEIEGNIKSISEIIPSGYSFYQEDNEIKWIQENGLLMTKDFTGETIKPGEYKELSIIYRWNGNLDNFGLKTNTATIAESDNPAGFVDSNKEDDVSISKVLLSVTTGVSKENGMLISMVVLAILFIVLAVVIFNKRKIKLK